MKGKSGKEWVEHMIGTVSDYFENTSGGLALLAVHETDSLRGHMAALRERWAVAQRARSTGELIRDQIDLLPESRNRMLRDQDLRRELWRGFIRDLGLRVRRLG